MDVASRFPREAGEHPDCLPAKPFSLLPRVGLTFGAHDRPKSAAKLSGQQLPMKAHIISHLTGEAESAILGSFDRRYQGTHVAEEIIRTLI